MINRMEKILNLAKKPYHYSWALASAIFYGFPSNKIKVIGVTGTKGKSSTTEILSAILEEAGFKTAVSNTIRSKMSMPGRFFIQKFIHYAVKNKCDYVILEMTSQGVLNYRHKFIELDALIFTNLSPEHIEAHGSYEKYRDAKLEIAKLLSKSNKRPRILVVNGDDAESQKFLAYDAEIKKTFSIKDFNLQTPLPGDFNKYNIQAAVTLCRELSISEEIIKKAVANFKEIKGRVEKIDEGQNFTVIVDYAHTADSMEKLFQTFPDKRKICVFGATGGGRDKWKRPEMGKVADTYCDEIILTNDDCYDEDPRVIAEEIAKGIQNKKPQIIVDRREAIKKGLQMAKEMDSENNSENVAVLVIGKGTDAYLRGPKGSKIEWSDEKVTREEIRNLDRRN